mgnify:FL=1
MQWIEVSVPTRSDEIDDVCAQLAELGAGGMVVEDETDFQQFLEQNHQYWDYVDDALEAQFRGVSRIKFYLADDDDGRAQLAAIRAGIGRELTTATVRDSDWENNWRQYYQPIETGERLVVVPEWLDAPADGRLPLRLDPGLIFGTGSHATTRMCLAALEHCAGADRTVLDLGCGSGILGIGALLLGCAHVTGCDIDPKAPEVAAANAALNGFYDDKFTVCAGDILADAGLRRRLGTGYDIVLANIVADVIIPLAALAPAFLTPGGTFVCSGIIESARAALEAGVKVGLGTDSSCPFVTQYDMWREVAYFAKYVGVSNAFALHTATQVNAELLGLGGETGTIECGKAADILVTRENPLDDLCALREPMHVMCRGDLVRKLKVKRIPEVDNELDTIMDMPAEALAEELARDGVA